MNAKSRKRIGTALLVLSLVLVAAANLHVGYAMTVGGETLAGVYSPGTVRLGEHVAALAAEEITAGDAQTPVYARRLRLSLAPPGGDSAVVTDALLRATPGVAEGCAVRADGVILGFAESGSVYLERLHRRLYSALPQGMTSARLDAELELTRLYTRAENVCTYSELVGRTTDAVPVIYSVEWCVTPA